jgi:2-polyprenyl-3-methyl-5-hydroxy-6-metoxy-1,4-benzoquinol methylase
MIDLFASGLRDAMTFSPIDHYDARSGGYSGDRNALEERERIALELMQPFLRRSDGRLLDVGCGQGTFLAAIDTEFSLSQRGWQLHGIDFSEFQVAAARSQPYFFAQANVEERIPFDDGSFDVVFCGELIEHLYNPDAFLEECHRVIVPGGHLVITTPNLQAWYNRFLFAAGIQPIFYETSTRSTHIGAGPLRRLKRGSKPVGHIRLLNARALRDLLASQGFRPVALRGAIFNAFPRPLRAIDRIFDRVPSLASGFVAVSKRLSDPPRGA